MLKITFVVFQRCIVIMQSCNIIFWHSIISQLSNHTRNNKTLHLHSSCSDVHIHYTVRAPSMSSPPPWTNQTKDYGARGRRHFTLAPPAGQRENYEAERVKDFPSLGSAVEHRKIAGQPVKQAVTACDCHYGTTLRESWACTACLSNGGTRPACETWSGNSKNKL